MAAAKPKQQQQQQQLFSDRQIKILKLETRVRDKDYLFAELCPVIERLTLREVYSLPY